MPTQRERILSMLRDAGTRGVHSFELFEARMPRAAATVHTLRRDGYTITSTPETLHGDAKGVRYVLRERAPQPRPAAVEASGLFEQPRPAPVSAIYGDAA